MDLRPAHLDRHLETVALVDSFGDRLVETAVLGLGVPVGHEHDLVGGMSAARRGAEDGRHDEHPRPIAEAPEHREDLAKMYWRNQASMAPSGDQFHNAVDRLQS